GETAELAGYSVRFDDLQPFTGPNYRERRAHFTITGEDGAPLGGVYSAKRLYPARQIPTTDAGIRSFGSSQLSVSLGDPTDDGGMVVRVWWKPLVLLIWMGAVVMAFGGLVSLLDRRLRVGAPSARRSRTVAKAREGEA